MALKGGQIAHRRAHKRWPPDWGCTSQIVTGDSSHPQHPLQKHDGLGGISHVDYIEVRWVDGSVSRIDKPAVNTYPLLE